MSIENVTPKKRGRPATGKQPHVSIRMETDLIAALDEWAKDHPVMGKSRSETVRGILSMFLNQRGYLAKD